MSFSSAIRRPEFRAPLATPAGKQLQDVLKDYLSNKQVWQAQKAKDQDMESLKALGYIE